LSANSPSGAVRALVRVRIGAKKKIVPGRVLRR
jgi:hypothetical protein